MSFLRPIGELLLSIQSVFVGREVVAHGPNDISFATQAMRLLMLCVRYFDLHWIWSDPPSRLFMRLFLFLSTLAVVVLLGYKKYSQNVHKDVSCETVRDVSAILLFSSVFGAVFMYTPSISEFFWAFSRVIDVVVEVPQLKMFWVSGGLGKWMTAYYCCIGSHVFVYAMHLIYRIQHHDVYDVVTPSATIAKGVVIAAFFAVRFFHQRKGQPLSGEEEPLLGPDARVHGKVDKKPPTIAMTTDV